MFCFVCQDYTDFLNVILSLLYLSHALFDSKNISEYKINNTVGERFENLGTREEETRYHPQFFALEEPAIHFQCIFF